MSNAEKPINQGSSISDIFYDQNGKIKVRAELRAKLTAYETHLQETQGISLPDYLFISAESKVSPTALAAEVGVSILAMQRIMRLLGVPIYSQAEYMQAKWKDSNFKAAIAEAARSQLLTRWQDPSYRAFMDEVNNDPKSIEAKKAAAQKEMKRRWQEDTNWREKMQQVQKNRWTNEERSRMGHLAKDRWANPGFRNTQIEKRQTDEYRQIQSRSAKIRTERDPEYQERIIARLRDPDAVEKARIATIERWKNPEFHAKIAEKLDETLPKRLRYSVHGVRKDLDFYALSMWEANFGRVLKLLKRDFYTRERFNLQIEPEYSKLFKCTNTYFTVDFITLNTRGQIMLYEIMGHPLEDPVGWAKLNMFARQFPELNMKPITPDFYRRIALCFADRINASNQFCGWENSEDNLYTNSDKYQ